MLVNQKLDNYFKADFESKKAEKKKKDSFAEKLMREPEKLAEKLAKEIDVVYEESQNFQSHLAEGVGGDTVSNMRGTIITTELQKLKEYANVLYSQIQKVQTESERRFAKNVSQAPFNMVAKEEKDMAKALYNKTVDALETLEPYLVATN